LFNIKTTKNYKYTSSDPPENYTMEFYTSILFHHLSFNPSLNNEIELIYFDRGNKQKRFLRYRNCKDTELTLPNFTFRALLKAIKPYHLLDLIKLLLLERKILLVQNDQNSLALIIESLLILLYPLYAIKLYVYSSWIFVNISYLGSSMTDYIDAPMPYIIGVPRNIWKKIKKEKRKDSSWDPTDMSVLDMDKGIFIIKEKVPDFPHEITQRIYNTLLDVLTDINSTNKTSLVFIFIGIS